MKLINIKYYSLFIYILIDFKFNNFYHTLILYYK